MVRAALILRPPLCTCYVDALFANSLAAARWCVACGADCRTTNTANGSALATAACHSLELVELLLEKGALPCTVNNSGFSPM